MKTLIVLFVVSALGCGAPALDEYLNAELNVMDRKLQAYESKIKDWRLPSDLPSEHRSVVKNRQALIESVSKSRAAIREIRAERDVKRAQKAILKWGSAERSLDRSLRDVEAVKAHLAALRQKELGEKYYPTRQEINEYLILDARQAVREGTMSKSDYEQWAGKRGSSD